MNLKSVYSLICAVATCGGSLVAFADGSVSGGGGGTLPEERAGYALVWAAIQNARSELIMLFNADNTEHPFYDERLYNSSPNIFEVIRNTKVGLKANGDCPTADHSPADGSIYGPEPGSICISVGNLAHKLSIDNVHRQTIALLAHEFAHLIGFNEQDASYLQHSILQQYVYGRPTGQAFSRVKEMSDAIYDVDALIRGASTNSDWNYKCAVLKMADKSFGERLSDKLVESIWHPFSRALTLSTLDLGTKLFGARVAACGNTTPQDSLDGHVYQEYLKAFGDQQMLNVSEFRRLFYRDSVERPSEWSMRRIQSQSDLAAESSEIQGHLRKLMTELDDLGIPTRVIRY